MRFESGGLTGRDILALFNAVFTLTGLKIGYVAAELRDIYITAFTLSPYKKLSRKEEEIITYIMLAFAMGNGLSLQRVE